MVKGEKGQSMILNDIKNSYLNIYYYNFYYTDSELKITKHNKNLFTVLI